MAVVCRDAWRHVYGPKAVLPDNLHMAWVESCKLTCTAVIVNGTTGAVSMIVHDRSDVTFGIVCLA